MAGMVRIEGRPSEDGESYQVWQGDSLLKDIPMDEARTHRKLAKTIKANRWKPVE